MITFDNQFLTELFSQAAVSDRKRQNFDLRTTTSDTSQRMLNALLPETLVPIHRHETTAETVVCLQGKLIEIMYEEVTSEGSNGLNEKTFKEVGRYLLCPTEGKCGMQIPKGVWHSVEVLEPSVIFEAKDGAYMRP